MNRRIFLRGAGGAALAAPFLSSLREARGEPVAPPKRLVIFYTPQGCITDRWWPALEDGPLAADTFRGTTLEVLGPYYRKLLMPRGFRSMNAYGEGQTIDPHDQAMGSKLTCAKISDTLERYATAESLDHAIAQQINPVGAKPLVLSVGPSTRSIKNLISFSGPDEPYPPITNPATVYASLTNALGSSGDPVSDYRVRRGQSILDFVREDLEGFRRLDMSQADRRRIDDWLDLLRDTEVGVQRCSADAASELGITPEAVAAASPSGSDTSGTSFPKEALATAFTRGGDMMMNLMALSMLCDQNRVLILSYPGYAVWDWDGIHDTHDHSGLSHRTGDFTVGGQCYANVIALLLEFDAWFAKKYARLVGLFDSIQEGAGTLLDSTATLWLPELSDGAAHNVNNLPILLAGSCGGYLKQGFAVNVEGAPIGLGGSSKSCDGELAAIADSGSTGGDVPINKLYVTLMNALGCTADGTPGGPKVTQFGQFDGKAVDSGISDPGEVAALLAAS
jgi:hypothetical protein